MNIVIWILFGGLAGWIASLIVGNAASLGVIGNIVVGIAGAFVGGWLADMFGFSQTPGVDRPSGIMSFIWAVIGAVVLLFLVNLLFA